MALPPPTCAEMRALYPVWGTIELSAAEIYTTRGCQRAKTRTPGAPAPAGPAPHPAGTDRRPSYAAARHGHRAVRAAAGWRRTARHSPRRDTPVLPPRRRPGWHA